MTKLLYFFKHNGVPEMVLSESNRHSYGNTRFLYTAESLFSFKNDVFKECLKCRYDDNETITYINRGRTLEEIINNNYHFDVSFFVGREIWRIGSFSTPYTVMSSLYDYYDELHKHEFMIYMSTIR